MKPSRLLACCLGLMATPPATADDARETVILLHGLGRTRWSMVPLARTLEQAGFRVINASYPSRRASLEELAHAWLPAHLATANVSASARVHFVTHSMGGIIVRLWLRDQPPPPNLGRVVMLAPPNAGSEVSDRLNAFAPFRWFTGVNGRRLGTGPACLPRQLGAWPSHVGELGIIAGNRTLNPLFSAWLPGADDGKVTVAATHLRGEVDHRVLTHSHTWLGWHHDTNAHVRSFLADGRFPPAPITPRSASHP